jgi:hypothetical protein
MSEREHAIGAFWNLVGWICEHPGEAFLGAFMVVVLLATLREW